MKTDFVKKGLVVGIIVLFIGMSVVPSTSTLVKKSSTMSYDGKTLYVGGSGPGNYSNIQEAVNIANPGDTVFVYNGTYIVYKFSIDKSISLIGEDKQSTIIDGQGANYIMEFKADFITISGFTIQNVQYGGSVRLIDIGSKSNNNIIANNIFNNSNMYAISMLGTNYNTVINNIVMNCGWYLNCSFGIDCGSVHTGNIISNNTLFGSYIIVWSATNTIISNNHVINKGIIVTNTYNNNIIIEKNIIENGTNISISKSADCIIKNNLFVNSESIKLRESRNIIVHNNTFNDSYGISITGDIVDFWNTHDIENNKVNGKPIYYYKNNQYITVPEDASQVILANCTNCTIENSSIIKSYGIQLCFSSNNIICNNTISESHNSGIKLQDSSKNNISYNTIKDNKNSGVEILSSSEDNIFYQNSIIDNYEYGIIISESSPNNYFYNNIIKGNHEDGIELESNFNTFLNNVITDNIKYGIYCTGSRNVVSRNHIANNNVGLRLVFCTFNTISQNNFIDNIYKSVSFYIDYKNLFDNIWSKNYYDDFNFYIKLIWGKVQSPFGYWYNLGGGYYSWEWIYLPGINIDWHPAQKPYDITTTQGCDID